MGFLPDGIQHHFTPRNTTSTVLADISEDVQAANKVFQPCCVQCDPDITCGTQWAFRESLPDTQAWATPVFAEAAGVTSRALRRDFDQSTVVLSQAAALVRHKFGNFVFRHVIEHGTERQRHYIVDVLENYAFEFSKHRLASHVVQLALTYSDPEDRQRLTNAIASSAQVLKALAHTQYGSSVVREIHSRC